MLPAFRSRLSVFSFCGLMVVLLGLPVLAFWIGHPQREQAYEAMSIEAGPLSPHVRELFHDPANADVLFLGSSLVRAGIDLPLVERGLTEQLGRPARAETLALNWQGLDMQYFLLRDYLSTHRAGLIVWNLPVPGARNLEPHPQAFHYVRFGEYSDALDGLSLRYRLALYGDMVLGAPGELLSHVRRNRLSPEEKKLEIGSSALGYYGSSFVPASGTPNAKITAESALEPSPYRGVTVEGKPLNEYERHFAEKILSLAEEKGSRMVFLHIPIDTERGMSTMPERGRWAAALGLDTKHQDAPMIGVASAELFANVSAQDFTKYYYDQHFNQNGSRLFTQSVLPAILSSYQTEVAHEH